MADIFSQRLDKRGVLTITGWWDGNSLWFPIWIIVSALISLLVSGLELHQWLSWRHQEALRGVLCGGAISLFFAGWAAKLLRLRRQLRTMKTAWELQQRFQMDAQAFDRLLTREQIKPRYNVQGHDRYHEEDFANITTLLRSSSNDTGSSRDLLHVPAESDATLQ